MSNLDEDESMSRMNELLDNDGRPIDAEMADETIDDKSRGNQHSNSLTGGDAAARQLLLGASREEVQLSRDQLMTKINQLEYDFAVVASDRDKFEGERNELAHENDRLRREALSKENKAKSAEKRRRAAAAALAASFRGEDLDSARDQRCQWNPETPRTTIGIDSLVHPDHACAKCGRRELGRFFKKEDYKFSEGMRTKTFSTIRELAALLDLREEWENLSALEAHSEMRKMVDAKRVSSNALKLAYRKALCDHAVIEAEELGKTGIIIKDEDGPVSDAVNEVLPCGAGRLTRKNCVVLVPSDSAVLQSRGDTQEIELVEYEDEPAMKLLLRAMEQGGTFPKSLFIVLKSSFSNKKLDEIRAYVEEIVKKTEVTVYISADLLPIKKDALKSDSLKSHQAWLTKWRVEKPMVNLVIISQISGLLNDFFPFPTLFTVSCEESKTLFEKAVKHLVMGVEFTMEPIKERKFVTAKRSEVSRQGYHRTFPEKKKTDSRDSDGPTGACSVCGDPTHKAWHHREPKRKRRN